MALVCSMVNKSRVSIARYLQFLKNREISCCSKAFLPPSLALWEKKNFTLKKCFKHAYPNLNGFLSHLIGVPIKFDSWIKRKKKSKQKKLYCHIHLSEEEHFGNCLKSLGFCYFFIWLPELHFFPKTILNGESWTSIVTET